MGKVNINEASIEDNEIVDLDVLPIEDDNESSITDKAEKTVKKSEKEEEIIDEEVEETTEEEDEEVDAEETDESEEDEKEETEETDESEEKADEKTQTPAENIEIDKEVISIQQDLRGVATNLKELAESLPDKPEKPEEDDPDYEEKMAQYRVDISFYNSHLKQFKSKQESARAKTRNLSLRQEALFREKHKGKDLSGFEQWIGESPELQTAFYTGSKTLDTLLKWYNSEKGIVEKEKKEIKNIKKKGIKIKVVDTKRIASGGNATGGNGLPAKYKYANLPEFKDLVKSYKGKTSQLTGERYTAKTIDDICKNEYKLLKGMSPI